MVKEIALQFYHLTIAVFRNCLAFMTVIKFSVIFDPHALLKLCGCRRCLQRSCTACIRSRHVVFVVSFVCSARSFSLPVLVGASDTSAKLHAVLTSYKLLVAPRQAVDHWEPSIASRWCFALHSCNAFRRTLPSPVSLANIWNWQFCTIFLQTVLSCTWKRTLMLYRRLLDAREKFAREGSIAWRMEYCKN